MTRKAAVAAVVLLLALAGAGCGRSRDALTVYSGRTQNLIGPLLERFNQETGIPIDVKYGDSSELALLLDEEGDRTPADVFLSQSPGATGFLAGKGRLGQLDPGLLAMVDPRFHNREGRWVGVSGRQRVLVYNSRQVREADLPDSVLDLTADRRPFESIVWPALAHRVPAFDQVRLLDTWAGHYEVNTLDHNAIIGPHPGISNFLFANGFSGHGLQQAPAVGRGLAEWIVTGGYETLDLSPLGFERIQRNAPVREAALRIVAPVITRLDPGPVQYDLIQLVANRLQMSESMTQEALRSVPRGNGRPSAPAPPGARPSRRPSACCCARRSRGRSCASGPRPGRRRRRRSRPSTARRCARRRRPRSTASRQQSRVRSI